MHARKLIQLAAALLVLLVGAVPAALGWGDDFDDNTYDPNLWGRAFSGDGRLTETNQRLEYTCTPGPDGSGAYCLEYALPYSTAWTVTVDVRLEADAHSYTQPAWWYQLACEITSLRDTSDSISLAHECREWGVENWRLDVATDGVPETTLQPTTADDGKIQIAWDGSFFTAYYDEGAGFQQLDQFPIGDWGMESGDEFSLSLVGRNEGCVLGVGSKLYFDNFVLSPAPETYWTAAAGSWFDANNWSEGTPTESRVAYIENGGVAEVLSATADANTLSVGVTGTGTVVLNGGLLMAGRINVGPGGVVRSQLDWDVVGFLNVQGGQIDATNHALTFDGCYGQIAGGGVTAGRFAVARDTFGAFEQSAGSVKADGIELGSHAGAAGAYDLVVGTQMALRALDDGEVALAALASADTAMNLPDFRASEQTFRTVRRMLEPSSRRRRVLIQTFYPDHYALAAAAAGDYDAFAKQELAFRRRLELPPFTHLVNVVVAEREKAGGERKASEVAARLEGIFGPRADILGPVPAPVARSRGRRRWQILVKTNLGEIEKAGNELAALASRKGPARIRVDVDPYELF